MKTKEIDVVIYKEDGGDYDLTSYIGRSKLNEYGVNSFKAKLIIELPEKKIEITESQFDEAWSKISRVFVDDSLTAQDLKKELGF